MGKKPLLLLLILVVLITGAIAYVLVVQRSQPPQNDVRNESGNTTKSPVSEPAVKGVYTSYTTEALSAAKGTVLLFFHAPWCPQCRAIEKSIEEGGVPDNVTILKVDYDTSQSLRQKYGVTLQTTFVKVDQTGNKLASYVAYEEPNFASVRRELLP